MEYCHLKYHKMEEEIIYYILFIHIFFNHKNLHRWFIIFRPTLMITLGLFVIPTYLRNFDVVELNKMLIDDN